MGNGAVIAMDPQTGTPRWKMTQYDVTDGGMLTTASDLLFTGGREGYFHALDARTGKLLWKASLGGQIVMQQFASDAKPDNGRNGQRSAA